MIAGAVGALEMLQRQSPPVVHGQPKLSKRKVDGRTKSNARLFEVPGNMAFATTGIVTTARQQETHIYEYRELMNGRVHASGNESGTISGRCNM